MGRYIQGDFLQAEEMFERLIGHKLALTTYTETHVFSKGTNHQIKISHHPVQIEKCEGFLKFDELRFEGWTEIPIEIICQIGQVLDIPPSVFGLPYDEVRVTYKAGVEDIPEEVCQAVQEIADLLDNETISEWNLPLSQRTLAVIGKYKT